MAATAVLRPSVAAPGARHRCRCSSQPQQQFGSLAIRAFRSPHRRQLAASAVKETKEAKTAEEITEKYGLEFGLWKVSKPGQF